ncbi:hypothetical protein CRUP_021184, partial [Coryphaenoides rupestris]
CADGYYGNPSLASGSLCRPCPCPDGPNSGRHFAASCYQDNRSRQIVHAATNAPRVTMATPRSPAGAAKPCQCSNNIDMSDMGACDRRSGECRKCLYNTEGPSCGICKSGYYGDASRRNCRTCDCDWRGIESAQCDRATGHCVCKQGVSGVRCDQCARGFSGQFPACQPCHQCFGDWDRIVQDLAVRTRTLADRAHEIQSTGLTGAYEKAFRDLEEKLAQAQGIVNARNATATAVGTLMELIEDLSSTGRLDILKNSNFLGAYDSIRSSYNRSRPCGGAGCRDDEGKRRCGGLNCDGAVAVAGNALESAKRAENGAEQCHGRGGGASFKQETAAMLDGTWGTVAEAKSKAEEAKGKAQAALDKATATKNKVERSNNDLRDLIKQTREFLTQEGADPDSIEAVANRVLELSIPASPQQIQYLAEEIKERVRSLSNVDAILEQTQDDVRKAEQLLLDAKRA